MFEFGYTTRCWSLQVRMQRVFGWTPFFSWNEEILVITLHENETERLHRVRENNKYVGVVGLEMIYEHSATRFQVKPRRPTVRTPFEESCIRPCSVALSYLRPMAFGMVNNVKTPTLLCTCMYSVCTAYKISETDHCIGMLLYCAWVVSPAGLCKLLDKISEMDHRISALCWWPRITSSVELCKRLNRLLTQA